MRITKKMILDKLKEYYPEPYFDGWEIHISYDFGYWARVHLTKSKCIGWNGVADGATFRKLLLDVERNCQSIEGKFESDASHILRPPGSGFRCDLNEGRSSNDLQSVVAVR